MSSKTKILRKKKQEWNLQGTYKPLEERTLHAIQQQIRLTSYPQWLHIEEQMHLFTGHEAGLNIRT